MQAAQPFIAKQSQKLAPAGFACEKKDSVAFYWSLITVSYVSSVRKAIC